jgi:hypothetical protein
MYIGRYVWGVGNTEVAEARSDSVFCFNRYRSNLRFSANKVSLASVLSSLVLNICQRTVSRQTDGIEVELAQVMAQSLHRAQLSARGGAGGVTMYEKTCEASSQVVTNAIVPILRLHRRASGKALFSGLTGHYL